MQLKIWEHNFPIAAEKRFQRNSATRYNDKTGFFISFEIARDIKRKD